jgi:copper chaperone CopZ
MKNIKSIILTIICSLFFSINVNAQTDTLIIKTSAVCDQCKTTIEKSMNFEKGVKRATLNVESKELTVIYQSAKTNPDKLRVAVTKIGYDADSIPADPKAYNKLHSCCKKQ